MDKRAVVLVTDMAIYSNHSMMAGMRSSDQEAVEIQHRKNWNEGWKRRKKGGRR